MILRSMASSKASRTREVTLAWVKTPAAVLPVPPFFEDTGCGAESEPRKNLPLEVVAAWRSAARSPRIC